MIVAMDARADRGARRGRVCRLAALCLLGVGGLPVWAVDVGLAGVFPGKALLVIDGGSPRTVAVGTTTREGVTVVSIDGETATIDVDGKRRALRVGQNVASPATPAGGATATLTADGSGHFLTTGSINGTTVRFLVDTGATFVALGANEARRLGIDPGRGETIVVNTANGQAMAARLKLDTVRVGEIVVNNVDAVLHQQDMPFVLLGMSFLNRMEMKRDGESMTLRKRY
ncbi:TIGR02281 family clan AA aspartic protease [Accumulibacter sp.]|uniref:retropepsin-like aspartic protease family protein n=1 Tax=Accumulibacter sp. TaxID=2053492 RepID=UPI0025FFDCA5|nr:TIGR02281 family clan AA aspartic protease [Accumulibacter sp.]MCM8595069.1 TIGR02281 family clan AA aspartic protease [Accumulibacter sp.]MCM8625452.1 TIGR02281 family clan AA aspartic protease [Accumulibacter sp.]MDS4049215.1 TIGR02281 family clan AA aspartic protease [Accumulibacter sp.]